MKVLFLGYAKKRKTPRLVFLVTEVLWGTTDVSSGIVKIRSFIFIEFSIGGLGVNTMMINRNPVILEGI